MKLRKSTTNVSSLLAAILFQKQKGLLSLKLEAASDGIIDAILNLAGADDPKLLIREAQIPALLAVVECLPSRHRLGNLETMRWLLEDQEGVVGMRSNDPSCILLLEIHVGIHGEC